MDNEQDQGRVNLYLTVPNNIANRITYYLISVFKYPGSTVLQKEAQEENTELVIELDNKYKDVSLKEYISQVRYYHGLTLEEFEFLSKYGMNQKAVKDHIDHIQDPKLFNEMLKYLDGPDIFNNAYSMQVNNPLKESVIKLLECGFKSVDLVSFLKQDKHTDKELQIENIAYVVNNSDFNWDKISLYLWDINLIEALVDKDGMSVSMALQNMTKYKVDNDSNKITAYEKFILSMYEKAQSTNEELQTILQGKYFNIEEFHEYSLNVLGKLLSMGLYGNNIFLEVFDRIKQKKQEINSDLIEFINQHHEKIKWHYLHCDQLEPKVLKQLIDKCDISIDNVLTICIKLHSTEDDTLVDIRLKNEYEELISFICTKAQQEEKSLSYMHVELKGLSAQILQDLLDCEFSDHSIFSEFFRQVSEAQNNLSSEQAKFLINNKDNALNYLFYDSSAVKFLTLDFYWILCEKGIITPDELIESAIEYLRPSLDFSTENPGLLHKPWNEEILQKIINTVGHNQFRDALVETYACFTTSSYKDFRFTILFSSELTEWFYKEKLIDENIMLLYGVYKDDFDIIQQALSKGADFNHKIPGVGSILSNVMEYLSYDNINKILDCNDLQIKANPEEIIYIVDRFSFIEKHNIFKKLGLKNQIQNTIEYLRGVGLSRSETKFVEELFKFLGNFDEVRDSLSESEKLILSDRQDICLKDLNKHDKLINDSGFTLLQLALISRKFSLALEMVKDMPELIDKSSATGINLFSVMIICVEGSSSLLNAERKQVNEIKNIILDHLQDVDIDLGRGETLADLLQSNGDGMEKVLKLTNDPLFYFLKLNEAENITDAFPKDDKIHIAVAHCQESIWSTGALSVSRLISKKHENVEFHLITPNHMERGGKELLQLFDGFVLPGGGDYYPKKPEFTWDDFKEKNIIPINRQYFELMEISDELNIPLFGMCAGAQNMILKEGGTLAPVKGYSYGQHDMQFITGTLPYFMSLDEDFQNDIINKIPVIKLPAMSYKSDTAHNYAGVKGKLGESIKLSAISEDGVVMSCRSGLKVVTQYHPEHYYGSYYGSDLGIDTSHQTNLLDSFIKLTSMHHQHKKDSESISPNSYVDQALSAMSDYMIQEELKGDSLVIVGESSCT